MKLYKAIYSIIGILELLVIREKLQDLPVFEDELLRLSNIRFILIGKDLDFEKELVYPSLAESLLLPSLLLEGIALVAI